MSSRNGLPANLEAEQAVLAAVLAGAPAPSLEPEHFYFERNRRIFGVLRELRARDILTLTSELDRRGELDDVGGRGYIAELVSALPAIGNAAHYADLVRDSAHVREVRAIGHDLSDLTHFNGDVPAAAERLRTLMRKADAGGREERGWLESAADLLSEPDPGPTPFTVEGLVTSGSIAAIVGPYKVGKTWLVLELAICIAAGANVLDRFGVEQGPVMLVVEESGRDALHRRLDKLSRGHDLAPERLRDLYFAANRRVRLDEDHWKARLVDEAERMRPRAVILDPFVRLKGATVDESVQHDVAPLLDYMRDLRDAAGAAVVFVHHSGHENSGRMRGSSDLEGYWESKITLSRDSATGICTIGAEHREAEATPRVRYILRPHEESETISLVPIGDDDDEESVLDLLIRYVHRQPGETRDEIARGVGKRAKEVGEQLEAGRVAGRLSKSSGGAEYRRGGWYIVPAQQPEISRPARGTTWDDTSSAGEVVPSSAPLGAATGTTSADGGSDG